jgi:hypothetical protein
MTLTEEVMSRKHVGRKATLVLLPAVWLLAVGLARAECPDGMCPAGAPAPGSYWAHPGFHSAIYCPINWWCMPKPPKLCYKCVCPKPLCDPCDLPNYGYYQTCWRPWLQQVDWSHCPVPPPTVLAPHYWPKSDLSPADPDEMLPAPGKLK